MSIENMYINDPNVKKILTWGSRDIDATITAIRNSIVAVVAGLRSSIGASAPVQVRPFVYTDVNLTSDFFNYSINAGQNALLPSGFQIPQGRAYAFYGFKDLTPGTKVLTYLQFNVNGTNYPLSPLPIYSAWTDEENTVYFSTIKATSPSATMQIYLWSNASQTVSFQLLGLTAVPLSGVNV
jgi:hypothetical protein